MDVFIRRQKGKGITLKLTLDIFESLAYFLSLGATQQLLFDQHPTVRHAPFNVVAGQASIKGQRGSEGFHTRVGRGSESSGPGFGRL